MARHGKFKARAKRHPPPPVKSKMASPHRFTMQQEALNTETHHRIWSNSNLRSKAVAFVSAGELQRSEFENVEQQDGENPVENIKEPQTETTIPNTIEGNEPKAETQVEADVEVEVDQQDDQDEPVFFFDSVGQSVPNTGLADPAPLADPDLSDDTSEDEVVFTGRNTKPTVIETDARDLGILHDRQELEKKVLQTEELTVRTQQKQKESHPTRSRRKSPARQRFQWSPENDDILADYIANMDQDDESEEEDNSLAQHKGVTYTVAESRSSSLESVDRQLENPQVEAGSAEDDGEMGVESSIDVLSKMYLDTKPDQAFISEKEDVDIELDTPNTSDMESDEDDEDDDDDLDADLLEQLALEYSSKKKKKGNNKPSFPSASAFADAIDADPYYGFDIMDFNRPSLKKSGRGKKPPALELMLSDSELEMHLQDVWQTDRKKKATKKKEREELRSQGILGRDPDDADLRTRYAKGMNMEELMTELRAFLMSSKTTLSLPPMTKNRRKTIHELAHIVNLKSQSRGNGLTRFPILVKTSRTPGYTRKTISKVDSLLSGRKLNRRLFQSWGPGPGPDGSKPFKSSKGKGGVTSGVTYMDGDVVGGSAPEIGAGNRGRAMLEKMGWSSGTALGATNNKGILQPVTHVVKNSRTGLG